MNTIRDKLVKLALEWQKHYGVAPAITTAISEYDAAIRLVGCSEHEYEIQMKDATAVRKGFDFIHEGTKYQIKANRPSGKKGSPVSKVGKASNYEWHQLIWILYDKNYVMQEAWQWDVETYRKLFHEKKHIRPDDMRHGLPINLQHDAHLNQKSSESEK